MVGGGDHRARTASGPSFCHVDNKRQLNQEIDDIIDGYQWWNGAIPDLISRDIIIGVCRLCINVVEDIRSMAHIMKMFDLMA